MILFDFRCPRHGDFEASHPICGAMGCDSTGVTKIFKKAPGRLSATTKRFDAGLKATAASYGLTNIRSARAGEAAYGGKSSNGILWGDQVSQITKGANFAGLAAAAAASNQYRMPDGSVKSVPNGMRLAANETGLTQRTLPKAERIIDPRDVPARVKPASTAA